MILSILCASPIADYSKSLDVDLKTNTITIDDMARDHITSEGLLSVLFQASSEVVTNGYDEVVGIKIWEPDAGSIFDLVGMKSGDMLTHLNKNPITGISQTINMLNHIKSSETFSYTLVREGSPLTFTVVVK